ncbi:dehydrodolichyl diphosphate syntase complex subunit NUS1 [Marchantia polymorpha subsp. ruderalis]|uniref:ditrans,polycis-polyprenyl diphosphate synthase [(2E,6E)-farnesyldiphosphate specific] n=2 Tax=Marchantia polymorpha TaxID=3197 RepID=A0AAF6ANK8_MARPO|nr:hypothetical protein MARPO_0014s0198 [Marchantia polymorpha]BBM98028.1 hypothetical protein Mp_1g10280 [Marchantia polymorpha subsp. ruderalis]|eukprot:PTQ45698.1 hypothetical protein MARPO_0014s0198 [Marchantia polymorpha]
MHHTIDWLLWRTLHLLFALCCLAWSAVSGVGQLVRGDFSSSAAADAAADCADGFEARAVAVAVVFETLDGVVDWEGKVAQLVAWLSSININIAHVTLFDPAGVLKRSRCRLEKSLRVLGGDEQQQVYGYSDEQTHVYGPRDSREDCSQLSSSPVVIDAHLRRESSDLRKRKDVNLNGESVSDGRLSNRGVKANDVKVELLSLQDGKQSLVRAARNVCENAYKLHYANRHQSKLPNLTEQDVNDSLQVSGCEGPDPDLLLLFGKTRSLHGFPPWRLRLTEIVHMGTLDEMTASSLMAAWKEFATKTHRYGR